MLGKLAKKELETQLQMLKQLAVQASGIKKFPLSVMRSDGKREKIVRVKEKDGVVYLCPTAEKAAPVAEIAGFLTGGAFKIYDLDALAKKLAESDATEVRAGWPDIDKRCPAVAKVLGIARGDECLAALFICPPDIEKVNEEIRAYVRSHGCRRPELDDCEMCPHMAGCDILEEAGEASRRKREGP